MIFYYIKIFLSIFFIWFPAIACRSHQFLITINTNTKINHWHQNKLSPALHFHHLRLSHPIRKRLASIIEISNHKVKILTRRVTNQIHMFHHIILNHFAQPIRIRWIQKLQLNCSHLSLHIVQRGPHTNNLVFTTWLPIIHDRSIGLFTELNSCWCCCLENFQPVLAYKRRIPW